MTAKIQLSESFQTSCSESGLYPQNLVHKSTYTYPTALKAYRVRLNTIESDLFVGDETEVDVSFRDLGNASGKEVEKHNIQSSFKLNNWLGLSFEPHPTDPAKGAVSAQRRDPNCRLIYIYAEHSRSELKITRDMLTQILTFHQVMPAYLDFISVFGAQSDPRDLRFSGFREQRTLVNSPRGPAVEGLGRSGRQFQLCYNLKGVTRKEESTNIELVQWSIRQVAIHHQLDVVTGTTLWIVTKGNLELLSRYKELTGKDGRPEDKSFGTVKESFRSSLAAHLLFCHWSTEDWRGYIRWLEEIVEAETAMAVFGRRGPGHAHQVYEPRHIQDLQRWEDKTNEVVMILEANVEVMLSLRKFYKDLKEDNDTPLELKNECGNDISAFMALLDDIMNDFRMQVRRAKLLLTIVSNRKELVLQHLQGQATDRMERLNQNMEKEAIVMRIVTLVTLVYLPATFVSTFFSTDVIKYQNQGAIDIQASQGPDNGSFSAIALYRWLQVTLPLTALTFLVAWLSLRFAERNRHGVLHSKQKKVHTTAADPKDLVLPMHNIIKSSL